MTPAGGVDLRGANGLTDGQIAEAVATAQDRAEELDHRLHGHRLPLELAGRRILVVDAAWRRARRWSRHFAGRSRGAIRLVAAAPVASTQGVALSQRDADRVVCPYDLMHFGAVGNWYVDFDQVDDEEVLRLLDEAAARSLAARESGRQRQFPQRCEVRRDAECGSRMAPFLTVRASTTSM